MERKIGEIFEICGEWYQCVRSITCSKCGFYNSGCTADKHITGDCDGRLDNSSVIFKKLEKVGESYEHCGKLYQCYKLPMEIEIRLLPNNCNPIGKDNLVEIEIKQNEDMEENKPKEDNPLTRVVYNYVNGKISDKELIKTIKEMTDEYPYVRGKKQGPPRSWEEFCERYPIRPEEAWIDNCSIIDVDIAGGDEIDRDILDNKNLCVSKEEAEAFLALMQLRQLRKAWVGDWEQDYYNPCYIIHNKNNEIIVNEVVNANGTLSFPTKEMAADFLNCFRDLCETAKILL